MNEVLSSAPAAASTGEHAPVASGKIAVLLVNLRTPEAAGAGAVRRYLKEFLTDLRVIEDQGPLWQLVLNGIVLPIRPRKKARDYAKIWNHERNESPLKTITRSQAEKLARALGPLGKHLVVDWGMRFQPSVRIAPPYYNDTVYIEALGSSTGAELSQLGFKPEVVLASFHGVPKAYVDNGDPYYAHCVETTRLLRERLNLDESKLTMTFQSRFGRGKWLEPATNRTIRKLAKEGVKNLAVITPGFSADCLETLEEIAIENARLFKKYGGENFAALPCLNDSAPGMLVIWQMALRELKGWV